MRIAVYTAITDNYEKLKENQNTSGADFYAFTDCVERLSIWNIQKPVNIFSTPRRNARWHKINSHVLFPEYDYTIWIDGSMIMKVSPIFLIKQYVGDNDLVTFKHVDRKGIFEEAVECKKLKLDDEEIINKQIKRYKDEGFDDSDGLAETKVLIRKTNKKVDNMNRFWLHEVVNFSVRDQLSFNYSVWKSGAKIGYIVPYPCQVELRYPGFEYVKHVRR